MAGTPTSGAAVRTAGVGQGCDLHGHTMAPVGGSTLQAKRVAKPITPRWTGDPGQHVAEGGEDFRGRQQGPPPHRNTSQNRDRAETCDNARAT